MSSNQDISPASSIPSWLNSEFVEKQLRDHYKNHEIQVVDFAVKLTSGELGNFASKIYKAKIVFKVSSKSEVNFRKKNKTHDQFGCSKFILMKCRENKSP